MVAGSLVAMAAPAAAQVPPARDITEFACPPTEVPSSGFGDVPPANVHARAIDCVAWYEVTGGTTAATYSPADPVTRDQMATFIVRVIDYVAARTPSESDGLPGAPSANAFPCDVSDQDLHYDSIQRLAAAGVVKGVGDNALGQACFAPGERVDRAQMATFIAESQRLLGQDVPGSEADFFVDDDGSVHEDSIDAITAEGITRGEGVDGEGNAVYDPGGNVSRDQMASFLARKLDRLVEMTVAQPPPTATVDPISATVPGGGTFEATVTASRGTIEDVTVTGCSISPPQVFQVANPAGAASVPIDVVIPAGQGGTSCRLDIVTTFVGGGRDTSSAIISITPS